MVPGLPPAAMGLAREVPYVDLQVSASSVTFSPSHPDVGEMVKITATVANAGTVTATADVFFYDGPPSPDRMIGNAQVSLGPMSQQQVWFNWNTSSARSGFHDIWVSAYQAYPVEVPESDTSNNNASREMTLTTVFSWVVDATEETFANDRVLTDILGVWLTGRLTLENLTLFFHQERDYQYGIVVDEKGRLTLRNAQITSDHAFRILVEGEGQLVVEPGCDISGKIISRDRAQVSIDNSTLTGGMDIMSGNFSLANSAAEGVFSFLSTNASIASDTVTSNQSIRVASTKLNAVDTLFQLVGGTAQAGQDTLNITGSSNVKLTGVVSGTINVRDTAIVRIYRYLTMHAEDTSGLAIPFATLWLRNNVLASEPAQNQTTNRLGDAGFTVITDVLFPGPLPKAAGSYNITGMIGNVQAQTNIQLPYYPTMTAESNYVNRTIVFEPIFYQTGHDPYDHPYSEVLGEPSKAGNWSHAGDIYIRYNMTINNIPMFIDQPSDFWAGIYIYPTGKLNFLGGGITSNHRLNVYIIGSGQLTIEPTSVMNGILNVNALIGLEDESHAKGRFVARNTEFNGSIMGALEEVRLSVTTILPHPYNAINGALAFGVETADIGNTTVTAPPPAGTPSRITVGRSLKFTNCDLDVPKLRVEGNVVSFSQCKLSGRYLSEGAHTNAGSILNLSATTLSIIECKLDYDDIVLSAQSFISTSTDYPIPLLFEGSSTGSLTNVNAPAIIVNDSAEVEVKWLFTLTVLDVFGTAVEGAEVTVRNYTTNFTIPGGFQTTGANGKVVFLLLGKKVYSNEVVFYGNYKAMVSKKTASDQTVEYGPYDISMRGNVDLLVQMDRYTNPLEHLLVHIDNLSRYANLSENDPVHCFGHVWKVYKGGYMELAANFPVQLSLSNSGAQFNGTTDGNGFFNITFGAPPPSERFITLTVTASQEGAESGSDSVFNLSVPIPRPDSLFINNTAFDKTLDKKYTRNQDHVWFSGNVEFMRKGRPIGVASNATVTITVSTIATPFRATTDATGGFLIDLGVFSTVDTYTIIVRASYTQGNLSVTGPPIYDTFYVIKAATAAPAAPIPVWVIALVIVLIVAGVGVGVFFILRMQAEAAKLVECGECGAFIPESALKCPKCGTEFETEVVKCSECGSWIPPNVTECPKCGAAFKKKGLAPPKPAPPKEPGAPGAPPAPQTPEKPPEAPPTPPK